LQKINQNRLIICKESDPDYLQAAWANYDEEGFFINITNFYGTKLTLLKGNKVSFNDEIWLIKGHVNLFYKN